MLAIALEIVRADTPFPHLCPFAGLLEGVPVVSWGTDLAYWGVKDVPLRRANGFGMHFTACFLRSALQ